MATESYVKTSWLNGSSSPPINAANLNKIEQGIYDNRELIIAMQNDIDDLQDDVVFQVTKSGSGTSEVVDLVPLTDGTVYIEGTKIKIEYPTTTLNNSWQIINGYTLLSALAQYIPNYDADTVQVLMHGDNGKIRWGPLL